MNEIIVEATGLPLGFPDPREEAYARAQEFRKLSPDERLKEIAALREFGMTLIRSSSHQAAIDQRWQAQEEEWRRIQRELFTNRIDEQP